MSNTRIIDALYSNEGERWTGQAESAMLDDENAASQAQVPDDATAGSLTPMGPTRWRGQLGSAFLDAVRADFAAHGVGVIARIRAEKPETYLKLVASLLPKDLNAAAGGTDELSDDQL